MRHRRVADALSLALLCLSVLIGTSANPTVQNITIGANESARLTSPQFPNIYPNDIDHTWIIQTEADYKISVAFSQFSTRRYRHYFRAGDGNDIAANMFFQWSGTRNPPALLSAGYQMWLRFTSDGSSGAPGFLLSVDSVPSTETLSCSPGDFDCGHSVCISGAWQCEGITDCLGRLEEINCDQDRLVYITESEEAQLVSTRYPSYYRNNRGITWIIRAEEDRKIRLSFSTFDTEYQYDLVRAGDGNSSTSNVFFEWSWNRKPPDLLSTGNTMWLRFIPDGGRTRQGFSLLATSVPSTENLTCLPDEFDCGHSVCISDDWRCDYIIDCLGGSDELNCGQSGSIYIAFNETAQLSPPVFPSYYPYNIDTTWVIETEGNRKIAITFPGDVSVSGRYVFRAGDGNDSANFNTSFFAWSRNSRPPDLLSNGNAMWLRYEPSGKGTSRFAFPVLASSVPFSDMFTCSPADFDCGHSVCINVAWRCDDVADCFDESDEFDCDVPRIIFIAENETAGLTSTLYPDNYPNNVDITWIIQTEEDHKIYITFLSFETQLYADYLRAGDGNVTVNPFFEWDGSRIPPDLLSSDNVMWMRFTSNYYYSRRGFSLKASIVRSTDTLTCLPGEFDCGHSVCISGAWQCDFYTDCVGRIDQLNCDEDRVIYIGETETAQLASSNYPTTDYQDNEDITWIIQTEEDRRVRLVFSRFYTEHRYDLVRAGDGNSTTSNVFFEWSWTKEPPDLLSFGNTMWLRFISDGSYRAPGFSLEAVSVSSSENLTCLSEQFDCGHSVCISDDWQCDYIADCLDGSDELNCASIYLGANGSKIISGRYPGNFNMAWMIQTEEDRKIYVTFFSFSTLFENGIFRAGDGTDSTNGTGKFFGWSGRRSIPNNILSTGNTMWLSFVTGKSWWWQSHQFSLSARSVPSTEKIICSADDFDCGHSVCIDDAWRCDTVSDCFNGKDELCCGTCAGRCYLDGPRGGECWCDDACVDYGDCCPDFRSLCKGLPDLSTNQPCNNQSVVDECDPDQPLLSCDVNAICTSNNFINYVCTCHPGYSGDGASCTDIDNPDITCPANLTTYTDCHKSYSVVVLPDADTVYDNSGVFAVSVYLNGTRYDVGDTAIINRAMSPLVVRYTATDNSSNSADCETYINVVTVPDGSFCISTGNPPNCICLPLYAPNCSCSFGYCGHDCSQSAHGVDCSGPATPYPNCTDIDVCDPGFSGPRCDADEGMLQCPDVGNECLDDGLSSAAVTWTLVDGLERSGQEPSGVTCTDSTGASVNSTGGVFGIGTHHVVCSSNVPLGPKCLISFSVSGFPSLVVPDVGSQCTDAGRDTATVSWSEVYRGADVVTVDCSDSGDGVAISASGGVFGQGDHTVTCVATNAAGCMKSATFAFSVMEGNLVRFGVEVGDSKLSDEIQETYIPSKDSISPTIFPRNFFPFCDRLHEKLYFTDNGVVVLSSEQSLDKRAFPGAKNTIFTGDNSIIAPFWADVNSGLFSSLTTSNVFWQVYDQHDPNVNQEMLDVISSIVSSKFSNFSANWALVITWSAVRALSSSQETNTFQALLATDGFRGFLVLNYDPCGMNWDFRTLDKIVIQGYSCGRSGTKVYVGIPNDTVYRPGDVIGNSGQRGRWIYRLDTLPVGFVNPRFYCHSWYSRQAPYPRFNAYYKAFADTCPCSLFSASRDWRFTEVPQSNLPSEFASGLPAVCFVRLFQYPGTPGPKCCYNLFTCDLLYDVRSPSIASVFERFPVSPTYYTDDLHQKWLDEEAWPRYYCCDRSALCHLYIKWRPLMTCRSYVPPAWVWFWGDPHIRTLDGLSYTFNGLGEYTLALIEDNNTQRVFELQGRTRQAIDTETGELSQATVYSGFAAEYVGEARVEIKLSNDSMDLVTTVNGTVVTPTAQGLLFNNLMVLREEGPIKVTVIYSSNIQFAVGVNSSMANVTVLLNQEFKGKTKGLLGVWDDDPSNDAQTRNGTLQPATGSDGKMTERDFFAFGQTWRITEEDSLFFYQHAGESWDSLNNRNFTPDFLQDLIDKTPPGKYDEALKVCGSSKVCVYDSLALNDTEIGMSTLALNEMNVENMVLATNFPPNLTHVETIEVVVGETFTLQIEAVDPDGDNITFSLLQMVQGASISPEDGLFTWTPANRSKVAIGFLATDGKANATLEPIVKLCECNNGGTCKFDQYASGTNILQDRFGVVLCQCPPGWSGEFCELDYDACADNPCFTGVACSDEDPPSFNSTCGPCPEGLEGDGRSCQDIDECELYKNQSASSGGLGCDQTCENVFMNYTCSCNTGYELHEDGRQCIASPTTADGVTTTGVSTTGDMEVSTEVDTGSRTTVESSPSPSSEAAVTDGMTSMGSLITQSLPLLSTEVADPMTAMETATESLPSITTKEPVAVTDRVTTMESAPQSSPFHSTQEPAAVTDGMTSTESLIPQSAQSLSTEVADPMTAMETTTKSLLSITTKVADPMTAMETATEPLPSVTTKGGLPTVAIVFIIVGCCALVLVIVCMLLCMCLLIQRQYGKARAHVENLQRSDTGHSVGSMSGDVYRTSDFDDEGPRMPRVRMPDMRASPYLQQGLPRREEFVRPYVATGMDGPYRGDPAGNRAGRVVRNPMAY